MNRKPILALLVLVLLGVACSTSTPEPTATNTPEPPTLTPTATDTPTPLPTSTPDRAATLAVRATQAAEDVSKDLESIIGDEDIAWKDGSLLWQQETPLLIKMTGPDGRYQPFAEDISATNFIVKSDVTWNATGILVCGIIFRSESNYEEGKQYQFLFLRFSGAPAWAIEVHEFGYFKNSPTKIKYSSAMDLKNGAKNQFVLIANEGEFTVFLNGVRQGKYYDTSKQRTEGYFAVLGQQDSGDGSCEYENTYVWALK